MNAYDDILLERAEKAIGRMLDFAVHSLHISADNMMTLFAASNTAAEFEHGDVRIICGMSGIELAYEVLDRSGVPHERVTPRHTINLSNEYWAGAAIAFLQWRSCLRFEDISRLCPAGTLALEFAKRRIVLLDSLPFDISEHDKAAAIRNLWLEFAEETASRQLLLHENETQEIRRHSLSPAENEKMKIEHHSLSPAENEIIKVEDHSLSPAEKQKREDNKPEAGNRFMSPLKKIREKNGLSQSQLAKAAGIPVRTVQQYEQGQKDLARARAEYLIRLASVLHCDPETLLANF